MRNTFILIYLLLIVIFLTACRREDNINSIKPFKQLFNLKNNDSIYIIPGSGCTGCISEIETFALKNVNYPNKYFLFTKINSVKLFRSRFGIDFIKKQNVILDTGNLFKYPIGYKVIYPLLIQKIDDVLVVKKSFKP